MLRDGGTNEEKKVLCWFTSRFSSDARTATYPDAIH